jgi:acetyl esterase/lipase
LIQRCQFHDLADLACESANRYPRQLQQAVALLDHLLHVEKVLPSSITLLGDSAGAHLLLSLVLHLSHPNPLVAPLKFEGRLSGAVLVSPWVTMDTSAASMQLNKDKDLLSATSLEYWARNFLGGADFDSWNTPTMAPEEWWVDLLVDDILVLYGDDELLRDDTSTFCERLRVSAYRCFVQHIYFSTDDATYRLATRKQRW